MVSGFSPQIMHRRRTGNCGCCAVKTSMTGSSMCGICRMVGAIAGQLRWLPEAERAGARSVMDGAWRDLAMAVGVWNGARSAV